jgi:oligopeptide transport system ATP-binding protein
MKKDVVLDVKNLTVSFKTPGGLVRAVRDINFQLYRGETLCIVGESGSGKSVTSRAILGILAGNAVVDSGEILYRGENLVKIEEQDFHRIRGRKIAMIFQDPLSSLNPIMKIGRQITEAILLHANHLQKLYEQKIENEFIELRKTKYRYRFDKKALLKEFDTRYKEIKNEMTSYVYKQERIDLFNTYVLSIEKAKAKFRGAELQNEKLRLKDELNKAFAEAKAKVSKDVKAERAKFQADVSKMSKDLDERLRVVKDEFKVNKPRLEEALKLVKEKAKREVAEYKASCIADYSKKKLAIQSKLESAKQSGNADVIKQLKTELSQAKTDLTAKFRITRKEAKQRAIDIMKEVGIPEPEKRISNYPFQFSGGMRQRIVIAIALSTNPELLICDEPTTALDVTIQSQILELINRIKKERGISVIFITHNLGVVANMAERIAVMYAGKIVEYGTVNEIFYNPKHPYTWALLSSMPDLETKGRLDAIPGTPPNMLFPPVGDAFANRNRYAMEIDYKQQPPMFQVSETHYAATWLLHKNAPKFDEPKIVSKLKAKKEAYERGAK